MLRLQQPQLAWSARVYLRAAVELVVLGSIFGPSWLGTMLSGRPPLQTLALAVGTAAIVAVAAADEAASEAEERTGMFASAKWMSRLSIPSVRPETYNANIRKHEVPVVVRNFRSSPVASEWDAWDLWSSDAIELWDVTHGIRVEKHEPDAAATRYRVDNFDLVGAGEEKPYSEIITDPEGFVRSCKAKELLRVEHVELIYDILRDCGSYDKVLTTRKDRRVGKTYAKIMANLTENPSPYDITHFDSSVVWECSQMCDHLHFQHHGILISQMSGSRDVVLLAPEDQPNLHMYSTLNRLNRYSRITACPQKDLDFSDDKVFPRLRNVQQFYQVRLYPGDALWVPAEWVYSTQVTKESTMSVSFEVNEAQDDLDKIGWSSRQWHASPIFMSLVDGLSIDDNVDAFVSCSNFALLKSFEKVGITRSQLVDAAVEIVRGLEPDKGTQEGAGLYSCAQFEPAGERCGVAGVDKIRAAVADYDISPPNMSPAVIGRVTRWAFERAISVLVGPKRVLEYARTFVRCRQEAMDPGMKEEL